MFLGFIGVVLAIAGFAYGIQRFTTMSRSNVSSFRVAHAVIGTTATFGLIVQVLLSAFVKEPRYEWEPSTEWPFWQTYGQFYHRYLGWLWLVFGIVACEMGTHMTSVTDFEYEYLGLDHEDEKYAGVFIGALLLTAFVSLLVVTWHKRNLVVANGAISPAPQEMRANEMVVKKHDVEAQPTAAFEKFHGNEIDAIEDVSLGDAVKAYELSQ